MSAYIIPADQPAYVPVGGNKLMLLGEFGRTVPVECAHCNVIERFKLIADELLEDAECDQLLDGHLVSLGWMVDAPGDVCPICAEGLK